MRIRACSRPVRLLSGRAITKCVRRAKHCGDCRDALGHLPKSVKGESKT